MQQNNWQSILPVDTDVDLLPTDGCQRADMGLRRRVRLHDILFNGDRGAAASTMDGPSR